MKNRKFLKNLVIGFCCVSIAITSFAIGASANYVNDVDYDINNPYQNVNWDTATQYKADLHSHTTASDGGETLKQSVERHYELGFDIIATTDHGTVNRSWTEEDVVPEFKVIMNIKHIVQDKPYRLGLLSKDGGLTENKDRYAIETSDAGDDYYYQYVDGTTGHKMLRVPFGIEHNPTSLNNAHVNSWFADYGHGKLGGTSDYITPIMSIDSLGGLSIINHPGEYTSARDEVYKEDAYDVDDIIYNYKINKFANILNTYDSCLGIDINSKGDGRTRFDRKLWDILLGYLVPNGKNVFAIATSDAHGRSIVDSGYTLMLMEENTSESLFNCMKNGEFFSASQYVGNYEELVGYSATMKTSSNPEAIAFSSEIDDIIKRIENSIAERGEQGGINYYAGENSPTRITKVTVDDEEDTISLEDENALAIHWISDGKVIATGNSIDLDDYSSEIGSYVRAEAFGRGGVVYTQAFTLDYEGAPEHKLDENFHDFWKIACGVDAILNWLQSQIWFKGTLEYIWDVVFH